MGGGREDEDDGGVIHVLPHAIGFCPLPFHFTLPI